MHIEQEDLRSLLGDQLSPDKARAVMELVLQCRECAIKLADLVASKGSPPHPERRSRVRSAASIPVKIHVLGLSEARMEGQIIESSEGGLKVRLPQPVFTGTLLQLRTDRNIYMGEVRHGRAVGSQFEAGLKIYAVTSLLKSD